MDMKTVRILIILFVTIPKLKSEKRKISNSLQNKIALDALLATPNVNMVVSPLALKFPLCKLANIATGMAKLELISALGLFKENMARLCYEDPKEAITQLAESNLILFNKIYLHAKYEISHTFSANVSEVFGVQVDKVGFDLPRSATSFINRWVESVTYRRIQDFLSPTDINKDTSMVIVNGAHFRGAWEFPFDIKKTKLGKFRHLNNSISNIPMMTMPGEFLYFQHETHDFKLITLYLQSWGAQITFVVPGSPRGLPQLLQQLSQDHELVRKAKLSARYTLVKVTLPRMRVKTRIDWTEYLKLIGIKKIFENKTSGLELILSSNKPTDIPHLSKAKQQIVVELDEFGPFRGPTEIMEDVGRMYMESRIVNRLKVSHMEFKADRPFLFLVNVLGGEVGGADPAGRERGGGRRMRGRAPVISSSELFVGVYYGPE